MPWWQIALDIAGGLLLLAAFVLAALMVRRRRLTKDEPTFDMSVRTHPRREARGWTLGVARYRGDRLEWFRVFSLSPRPARITGIVDIDLPQPRNTDTREQERFFELVTEVRELLRMGDRSGEELPA